jgi:hypothetical protein
LSERRGGLELGRRTKPGTDTFGHEPALVARYCSPAKLLGFPKLVGTPRCNDARRCHKCDWHSQGRRAAMAWCRTSEALVGAGSLGAVGLDWIGSSGFRCRSSNRVGRIHAYREPSTLAILAAAQSGHLGYRAAQRRHIAPDISDDAARLRRAHSPLRCRDGDDGKDRKFAIPAGKARCNMRA